jgi:hypothetical protein
MSVPVGTWESYLDLFHGTYMLLGGRIFDPIIILLKGTIRPELDQPETGTIAKDLFYWARKRGGGVRRRGARKRGR